MTNVRHALERDLPDVSLALARAFATDPLWCWALPDSVGDPSALVGAFDLFARQGLRRGHLYTLPGAAAVWSPPDVPMFDDADVTAFAAWLLPQTGDRADQILSGLLELTERHPHEPPHFYLLAIGTEPARQGAGLGSQLLHHVLDRCDEQELPAYLESTNPINIPFYERHGFRIVDKVTMPEGPTFDLMWRDPR
jgi:ribosomal protein S18 acetylase RimI-like enzyme